jgi:hypothetical protein
VFIISRAHNVTQAQPPSAGQYVCMSCGMRGILKRLFGSERCTPTIYRRSSGWVDEATPEERVRLDIMELEWQKEHATKDI